MDSDKICRIPFGKIQLVQDSLWAKYKVNSSSLNCIADPLFSVQPVLEWATSKFERIPLGNVQGVQMSKSPG